jgi:DNA invertase Pin-like site-specific DNA recombinase
VLLPLFMGIFDARLDRLIPRWKGPAVIVTTQLPELAAGGLAAWAERTGRRRAAQPDSGGLRFVFYGRVPTEDHQDPVTSRVRQRDQAGALVAGHGQIVAEFFDIGQSRTLVWARRPQAAALVAELADPERGWDAVVIGEYERAFYGSQFASMAPLFEHYGIQLWTPEVGGRVDFGAEDYEQTMMALGLQSKREITRTRIRVRTAMAAQTREQGRYLGGRPPYGYRLADAGPHPNKAHAAWGRRARRLEPDPQTAPQVAWIFAQRLAGHSMARIARGLNDAAVPCPSAADPDRNPHRSGEAWTLHTVRAILGNPRYTGRQVWNRQRTDAVVLMARMMAECIPSTTSWVGVMLMSAKPALARPSRVFGEGQRAGDASDVAAPLGAVCCGQVVFGEDVGDAEPAAGPEHAETLGENGGLVAGQVDHAVGDDHVDRLIRKRDRFDMALEEFGVGGPGLGGIVPGEVQHLIGHVQAVGLSGGADPVGG